VSLEEVMRLRAQGRSVREIMNELKVSRGTVQSRLREAKKRLSDSHEEKKVEKGGA